MTFEELCHFIDSDMRMTFIYQPVVLRTLLTNRGRATVREIALEVLRFDEAQVDYYIRVIKRYPKQVLSQHGVIESAIPGVFQLTINFDELTQDECNELIALCDKKIDAYLKAFDGIIGEHRYNAASLSSGSVRYEVLKRAKGRCALCGVSVVDSPIDIDHIVPRSRGGSNEISNLQTLCERCNRSKKNRDQTDFRYYGVDSQSSSCVFCDLRSRLLSVYNTAQSILDSYPISTGHTLIIPKRHVLSPLDLSSDEMGDIYQLSKVVTAELQERDLQISGFNIGFNIGIAAGQTIDHAHLHIIPRRIGDIENPRGGIRNVLPDYRGYR